MTSPEVFSLEEVQGVLRSTLPESEAGVVLDGFRALVAKREGDFEEYTWKRDITELWTAFYRTHAADASDTNIEGWFETLDESAIKVLQTAAVAKTDSKQLTVSEPAIRLAAVSYIDFSMEIGQVDELDVDLIESGLTDDQLGWLIRFFGVTHFVEATDANSNPASVAVRTIEDLQDDGIVIHRSVWEQRVAGLADDLKLAMDAEGGFELPKWRGGMFAEERAMYGPEDVDD